MCAMFWVYLKLLGLQSFYDAVSNVQVTQHQIIYDRMAVRDWEECGGKEETESAPRLNTPHETTNSAPLKRMNSVKPTSQSITQNSLAL
jgi:hypothetical protein